MPVEPLVSRTRRSDSLAHFPFFSSQFVSMSHFAVFANDRFEGVGEFVDRFNHTGNTLEFTLLWEATTRDLGRAAFTHHLNYPEDTLVIVPSIVDVLTWDDVRGAYVPFYTSSTAAVTAFAEAFHDIVVTLYFPPAPCRLIFTDVVGLNSFVWTGIIGGQLVQDWIHSIVPRINDEVMRANAWNGVPGVPLGWRVHHTYQTQDGPVVVHDYRSLINGYLPGLRQRRRWARVLVNLLEEFMDGLLHN